MWGFLSSPLPVYKSFSKDRSDCIMESCTSFLIALLEFLLELSLSVACAGPVSCCVFCSLLLYSSHLVFYVCVYIVVAPSQFPIPIFGKRKRQSKG